MTPIFTKELGCSAALMYPFVNLFFDVNEEKMLDLVSKAATIKADSLKAILEDLQKTLETMKQ